MAGASPRSRASFSRQALLWQFFSECAVARNTSEVGLLPAGATVAERPTSAATHGGKRTDRSRASANLTARGGRESQAIATFGEGRFRRPRCLHCRSDPWGTPPACSRTEERSRSL